MKPLSDFIFTSKTEKNKKKNASMKCYVCLFPCFFLLQSFSNAFHECILWFIYTVPWRTSMKNSIKLDSLCSDAANPEIRRLLYYKMWGRFNSVQWIPNDSPLVYLFLIGKKFQNSYFCPYWHNCIGGFSSIFYLSFDSFLFFKDAFSVLIYFYATNSNLTHLIELIRVWRLKNYSISNETF